MSRVRSFGQFWWDFVIGDDWRLAVGGLVALAAAGLAANTRITAWWVAPAIVIVVLVASLARATPRRPPSARAEQNNA